MLLDHVKKKLAEGKRRIAVSGTHKGVGVTHTALMLAFFLADEKREKTAYVELAHSNQVDAIAKEYVWTTVSDKSFSYRNLTLCCNASIQDMLELLQGGYKNVILDLGENGPSKYKEELLRCDQKLIVVSGAPWEKKEVEKFMSRTSTLSGCREWDYLLPCKGDEMILDLKKRYAIHAHILPYNPNPFQVSASTKKVLNHVLHM